ncbi:FG-GAP-like repeat-containing protein [Reichenbachiella sp. MALMAid0571]|uniref:FG-GAP-like repeat-containing protein n=1 Tax=Reichenbachiella sp. MALMAid0571 TaxID=3143939 RepID=UPI0032DF9F59
MVSNNIEQSVVTSFETAKNNTLKALLAIAMFFVSSLALSQPGFIDVTQIKQFEAFEGGPTLGSGVNAIDYDKDGDLDLYVLSDENTPNRLYKNDGSGNFKVVEVGLSLMMRSRAAVWFDYDGDHRLDVFVAGDCSGCGNNENFKLFRQLDNEMFEDMTSQAGISLTLGVSATIGGVAAGDVNNDGYIDLVVTQYRGLATLYLNLGNGQFTDATASSGIKDTQLYFQPVIFDFNKDGWADIYLTVDYTENKFWLNNGDETFKEIGTQANLDNDHNDMGVALGDYDADEDMDIYVSNIDNPNIEGHHNVLLKNKIEEGEFVFDEVSKELGVEKGGWGWGVTFLDVDNDGLLDLAATNGWVTEETYQSKLWRNNGEVFKDISNDSGFNDFLDATTLISFDFDRDGDLDLAQTLKVNDGQTVALRLLENQLGRTLEFKNYLVVKPRMLGANHWAIGATVRIKIGDKVQTRPLTAGISFYGQEPSEAFFGIGDATNIDEVSIIWPGGATSMVYNIESNRSITINDDKVLHFPIALKVVYSSSESVHLVWKHNHSVENEYVIERSISGEFDDVVQFKISSSTMEFMDVGLKPATNYHYRVQASNGSLLSEPSKEIKVLTQPLIHAPTNLSGHILSNTSISLSWLDNASNEDGYILQRSQSETFDEFLSFDLPPGSHYYEDKNLNSELTYFYRVQAYRGGDTSDFSQILALSTIITGMEEKLEKVHIYPNPSNGNFHINIHDNEPVSIKLMNQSGKKLNSFYFENSNQLTQSDFDLQLPSGIYFVSVETGIKNQVFKLIISK